jgi:prepilin-type N-terminal cleavage/methylation domain-containing protein
MKPGFTLLEFLLATALAGLLSVFLLSSLWSINRSVYLIDEVTRMDERAALINSQIERSFSGACIPVQAEQDEAEPEKNPQDEPLKQLPAQESKDKKRPPLQKIFVSEHKEKNILLLSCITNNPLVVYWGEQWGKAVPRIARVIYRLKPEKKVSKQMVDSYTLVRQESDHLEFASFDKIKGYEIAAGIKSFVVEFGLIESEDDTTKIKTVDRWDSDSSAQTDDKEKKSTLPTTLKIRYELWDSQYKRSREYSYLIYILGGQPAPAPQKPAANKPEEKKSNLIEMMHKQVFPQQAQMQKN